MGLTMAFTARMRDHRRHQPWWSTAARIELEHHADRASAAEAEMQAITAERPTCNIIGRIEPTSEPLAAGEFRWANVIDLMATDLSQQADEALVAGYHDAVRSTEISAESCRRILATLRERHSWSELVKLTGDAQTTLYNRANPRRRAAAPDETTAE